MMDLFSSSSENSFFTVSELTRSIRSLLENEFQSVVVQGEISNYRSPGSGHLYFTLKDESAVLSAVMFRGDASRIRFPLQEGLLVKATGRITVYEARGQYQIQIQKLELAGQGNLQQQFEALKQKLLLEGLFETDRKKSLPIFPEKIGLITSLQGAVIQDFIRILERRAPGIIIQVRGVRVQGEGAADEIIQALHAFESEAQVDAVILARGGGSLEDLWQFNHESLARAIAASPLPTISAIGHETDFTIADFVADLRAPTPSAAAELISRDWSEWREMISQFSGRLHRGIKNSLDFEKERIKRFSQSSLFREPIRIVQAYQQRVDEIQDSLRLGLHHALTHQKHRFEKTKIRWTHQDPIQIIQQKKERILSLENRLRSLSPDETLKRGFAWVTNQQGELIRTASANLVDQKITVRMNQGSLEAKVEKIHS